MSDLPRLGVSTISVDYDCGLAVVWPLPLADGQSMLAHSMLIDWLVEAADIRHDETCARCNKKRVTGWVLGTASHLVPRGRCGCGVGGDLRPG